MKRRQRRWLAPLLMLTLLWIGFTGCGAPPEPTASYGKQTQSIVGGNYSPTNWLHRIGGPNDQHGYAMATNPARNKVYAAGLIRTSLGTNGQPIPLSISAAVVNGAGYAVQNTPLATVALGAHFIVTKYTLSGTRDWFRLPGGIEGGGAITDLAVDSTDNIYISGFFYRKLYIGTREYINSGVKAGFLAKFNSNGQPIWTLLLNGTTTTSNNSIEAFKRVGTKIVVTGTVSQGARWIRYDGQSRAGWVQATTQVAGLFVSRHTDTGSSLNFSWNRVVRNSRGLGITTNSSGSDIYVCGEMRQSFTVGVLPLATSSATIRDGVVAKLDSTGSWQWARSTGGSTRSSCVDVGLRRVGNYDRVVIVGNFYNTMTVSTFGWPQPVSTTHTSLGTQDVFHMELSTSGFIFSAKAMGGTGYDRVTDLDTYNDRAFVTGYFNGNFYKNTTQTTNGPNFQTLGSYDGFLLSIGAGPSHVSRIGGTGLVLPQGVVYAKFVSYPYVINEGLFSTGHFQQQIQATGDPLCQDSLGRLDMFLWRRDY